MMILLARLRLIVVVLALATSVVNGHRRTGHPGAPPFPPGIQPGNLLLASRAMLASSLAAAPVSSTSGRQSLIRTSSSKAISDCKPTAARSAPRPSTINSIYLNQDPSNDLCKFLSLDAVVVAEAFAFQNNFFQQQAKHPIPVEDVKEGASASDSLASPASVLSADSNFGPFVAPQSTAGIAGIHPVSASSSSIGSSSTSTPAPTLDTSLPLRTSLLLAVVIFTPLLVLWLASLYPTKAQGASIPACLPKKTRSVHRTAQRPGRCSIAPKRWLIWALFLAAALVVCAVPNQLSDQGVDINRNHVNDSGADLSTGETKTRSDLNDNVSIGAAALGIQDEGEAGIGGANLLSRTLFGGEDLLEGNPFWHERFSEIACEASGFAEIPMNMVAWHADYTDSYSYNPLYWFKPLIGIVLDDANVKDSASAGLQRFKAARSIHPDLVNVHYDDIFTTEALIEQHYRYVTGCLVGLHWAAEIYEKSLIDPGNTQQNRENIEDPIGAAHNILGITLHALQDFYSHSNWIDEPSRRTKTFFDVNSCDLESESLYTGAYEESGNGQREHGKPSIICSLTAESSPVGSNFKYVMDIYCAANGILGISNSDLCIDYKDCNDNRDPDNLGGTINGIDIPSNTIYFEPAGINLDNTWNADIGVQERGIDLTGSEAFEIASNLAIRASKQMLQDAESFMIAQGHGDFWNLVKTTSQAASTEDDELERVGSIPFENFKYFPIQFISAGSPDANEDDYYLRVVIKTSSEVGSGTDADIKLIALWGDLSAPTGSMEFNLDYMKGANALIAYNDFESGDEDVYTVGPFPSLPTYIGLKNDAPDGGDILEAFGQSILNAFVALGEAIVDFFTNEADYIGTISVSLDASWLNSISVGGNKYFIATINGDLGVGGTEGNYEIWVEVDRLTSFTFRPRIIRIVCLARSSGVAEDSGSSDEPFFHAALYSYGDPTSKQYKRTAPLDNIVDDSVVDLTTLGSCSVNPGCFDPVTFNAAPDGTPIGAMVFRFEAWEADTEPQSARDELYGEFQGQDEPEEVKSFFTTIGDAIGQDWQLDSIRAYAFRRGRNTMEAGQVLWDDTDRWIKGKEFVTFPLSASGLEPLSSLRPVTAVCQSVTREVNANGCVAAGVGGPLAFNGGSSTTDCGSSLRFSLNDDGPYDLGVTDITMTVVKTTDQSATDSCETTITVEDTTNPVIDGCSAITSNFVVACSGRGGTPKNDATLEPFFSAITASDFCPFVIVNDAPDLVPVGNTDVDFTATDSSGNSAVCTRTITVEDTTLPEVSGCVDVTVECSVPGGARKKDIDYDSTGFFGGVTATDVCDPDVEGPVRAYTPDLSTYPVGSTAVTFTATDSSGNSDHCTGLITVEDTTPPVISGCVDVTVECSVPGGTPKEDVDYLTGFFGNVTATDVCDPDVEGPVRAYTPHLSPYPVGVTEVDFTATDMYGKSASCSGEITVEDTTSASVSIETRNITLSPPNNKYFEFDLFDDFGVSSRDICCGSNNSYLITGISSDESDKTNAKQPSFAITGNTSFSVQAQRDGSGNGRTYTIAFTVTDCHGNKASTQVFVKVPRGQGPTPGPTPPCPPASDCNTGTRKSCIKHVGSSGEDSFICVAHEGVRAHLSEHDGDECADSCKCDQKNGCIAAVSPVSTNTADVHLRKGRLHLTK